MRHWLLAASVLLITVCSTLGTPLIPTQLAVPVSSTTETPQASAISTPAPTIIPETNTVPAPVPLSQATTFPDPTNYRWMPVISGLYLPTDIKFPDDGSGRMFIVEQNGRIRIIQNGELLPSPFLDITDRVGSRGSEQGLLGLAFHPNFKDNPYIYVNYTDINGNTVIARFTVNGNTADPASEKDLLHVDQPFQNHNGGEMTFGPDGFLYMGLGDGGSAGDPFGNAQNTDVLLGKILRIDVDHGEPYAIPPSNPFANGGGKLEIFDYGLRNPWRFSFDTANGDLYIADVGQDTWEEVDYVPADQGSGLNFGWNYFEANHRFRGTPPTTSHLTYPVAEYNHTQGNCSITGGYVYRGAMSEWQGIYLYGDFCSGRIWGLIHTANGFQSQVLFETRANITTFGQDSSGETYFAGRDGTIYQLR